MALSFMVKCLTNAAAPSCQCFTVAAATCNWRSLTYTLIASLTVIDPNVLLRFIESGVFVFNSSIRFSANSFASPLSRVSSDSLITVTTDPNVDPVLASSLRVSVKKKVQLSRFFFSSHHTVNFSFCFGGECGRALVGVGVAGDHPVGTQGPRTSARVTPGRRAAFDPKPLLLPCPT